MPVAFRGLVDFIVSHVPSNEVIKQAIRQTVTDVPWKLPFVS